MEHEEFQLRIKSKFKRTTHCFNIYSTAVNPLTWLLNIFQMNLCITIIKFIIMLVCQIFYMMRLATCTTFIICQSDVRNFYTFIVKLAHVQILCWPLAPDILNIYLIYIFDKTDMILIYVLYAFKCLRSVLGKINAQRFSAGWLFKQICTNRKICSHIRRKCKCPVNHLK